MINDCFSIENNISKIAKTKRDIKAFNLNDNELKFFPIYVDKIDINDDKEPEQ